MVQLRPAPRALSATPDIELLDHRFPEIRDRLVQICHSVAGDASEDAVQEAYLIARKTIGQLRDADAIDGWLTTIAIRRCIDRHRRDRRFHERLPALFHRQQRESTRDLALTELIEQLPVRQRVVIVLHYGHGYPLPEVGRILGLSHTNVRSIILRARRRLYAAWQEADDD